MGKYQLPCFLLKPCTHSINIYDKIKISKQNHKLFKVFKMANIKRKTFSKEEIKILEDNVLQSDCELSKAQSTLGQFKRAKINAQQNHAEKHLQYRYFIILQY